MTRSSRAEVRNPVLLLPAAARLQELPPDAAAALEGLLRDIAADAAQRAEACWRKSKAPMAAYWKAVGVYSKHAARVVARGRR